MTKYKTHGFNNSMQKIVTAILFLSLVFVFSCSGKSTAKPNAAFDAEQTFARANELMDKKSYEEARTALTEIKSRDLTKKYAPLAHLRIADSYIKEEEPERAIEEHRKFLEIYPDHKYSYYAQFQISMAYFNQIEDSERGYGAASRALEEFEKLKKMFPRNPYKDIVDIRIEKCKDIIAEYEFLVGVFYFKKDSYDAAIKRFEGLLQRFPGFKKEADVLYNLALSYKKSGENERAFEYFSLLFKKYPNSNLIPEATKALSTIKK
ncbi:MAG: tetratricopeptide repeat protein [Nitrospirae bacterium]|nr:tetratricopeptide repeat protein [Nitrospirota bacterium]